MPVFNDMISRNDANVLIPVEQSNQIIQSITEESAVLRMARRLPNMTSNMLSMPVLANLPYAYFVEGDTGMKQTTKVDWSNKIITAEEIAVIVPVPDAVLADSSYDIWAQIRPLVAQAFGQKIDAAILFGAQAPSSWPEAIIRGIASTNHAVNMSDDLYDDIMGADGLISLVEQSGYMVNGYMASMRMRGALRGVRDQAGQPIFRNGMTGGTSYQLDGQRIEFPRNGVIPTNEDILIGGDWSQLVYSIRQDMTVTKTNTGVISDDEGKIIYNLYQQDMTALRFVMRLGWQLPNPINAMNPEEEARYPFAMLAQMPE